MIMRLLVIRLRRAQISMIVGSFIKRSSEPAMSSGSSDNVSKYFKLISSTQDKVLVQTYRTIKLGT